LVLKPLTAADADDMVSVLAAPELYAFIGGEPPEVESLRARYERLAVGGPADGSQEWHNWIARRAEDGVAVGTVQATVDVGGVSVGVSVKTGASVGTGAQASVETGTRVGTGPLPSVETRTNVGAGTSVGTGATVGAEARASVETGTSAGTGTVAGRVGEPAAGRSADVAWVVGAPFQGRGYAVEAASALVAWLRERGVTEIRAHVHPGHAASARVAERIGLIPSGVLDDEGEQIWRSVPAQRLETAR
jgi:L-amino acid N-acyltransferase YncA